MSNINWNGTKFVRYFQYYYTGTPIFLNITELNPNTEYDIYLTASNTDPSPYAVFTEIFKITSSTDIPIPNVTFGKILKPFTFLVAVLTICIAVLSLSLIHI
eukprot:TRINITY_DN3318_c0_g2_i5.p1 TRINITY_DN3318_c0_g2~~TRINITY_DN3318_c0_g2_i5.p1  ORF type:complete len:102 (+),score=11.84 TRINITY_DN3318_c0_g2_i5:362-667(+)